MLHKPQVSVVMPYYNNEKTLVASIASFCQQTIKPCEIIVVDDGSPIPAADVLVGKTFEIPVFLKKTNRSGQSGATNFGIAAAKGELVFLTCADIVGIPQVLETHIDAHNQAQDEIAVLGYIAYPEELVNTPFMLFLTRPGWQYCFDYIINSERVSENMLYSPNMSLRKVVLDALEGFDERFVYGYQDTDMGLRVKNFGIRVVYRSQARVWHHHPNNLRQFVKRQKSIGEASLYMIEKNPYALDIAYLSAKLPKIIPELKKLPYIVDDTEMLEKNLLKKDYSILMIMLALKERYRICLDLAFVSGMVKNLEHLRQLIQLPEETLCYFAT